jgi:phage-related minor tail protein
MELNKQFNFLDVSTFKQIIAAQKLGNTFQATAIAQTAYMDALKSRSAEMKGNLGTLETGWKALGNTAKEAWDKMLNIGREQSLDAQIGGLQKSIAWRKKEFANQFGANTKVPREISEDQTKLEGLFEQRRIARNSSDRKLAEQEQRDKELAKLAESAKPQTKGGKQISEFDKYIERLDKQEQALKQLSFEEIAIDDLREGRLGKLTKTQEEDLLWRARKQDSIKETAKINAAADAAESAGIQRIRSEKEQQIAEGKRLAESLATPAEILAAKEAALQKQLTAGYIDQDTYHRARIKNNNEYSAALEKTTEAGRRLTESLFTPADKLAKREEEYQRLLDANEITRATYDAAKKKSIQEYLDDMDKASGKTKEAKSLANELGLTFQSAFEDAIVGGKGLSEVFKGLEKDIARVLIRKQVTEPFTQAVSKLDLGGLLGGLFGGGGGTAGSAGPLSSFSSFAGGGYTGDGARSGGLDGQGGYLAMLHPQESVVDHAKGQSMGGGTSINQSITIDARGADAGVTERIIQAMRQTKAETLAAVQAQANRGGSFARAVGRA